MRSTAGRVFGAIKRAIIDPIRSAVSFVREQIGKLKGLFAGLVLRLPKIPLPHFQVHGKFKLNPPSVPTFDVNWYARGGSFAAGDPALIGVGDQGRGFEHVLRDDQIVSLMRRAIQGTTGQRPISVTINQPVRSYAETRRAIRDAAEQVAW